ncbi:MAG: hypothetical protein AABZ45_07900 [Pseudomonadota bacterium]
MSEPQDNPEPELEPEENEVLRAAREAKEARMRASESQSSKKGINWKTAAAAGLGSAAIIAALIYSQRDKDDD